MKTSTAMLALLAVAGVGWGGFVLGTHSHTPVAASAVGAAGAGASAAASAPRRILYYRNPMGLPDTSPAPKKDPMGMDYVPVYAGEDPAADAAAGAGRVRLSTDKVQKLGVRTEAAALRALHRTLRAAGRIEPDERRIALIAPKFEGWVERLHVNVTGQYVARGEPLFEVYSPELVSAQREYAIAIQGLQAMQDADDGARSAMRQLADASLVRLRNWDLPADEIAALVKTGQARRTLTLRSPAAGIVTEKKAIQGMRFMPGETLYQVSDLSSVWVLADVQEQDIAGVRSGARARVTLPAFPGQAFEGRITYVYPTLQADTRTVPVRVELANPRGLLKPAMYAQVEIQVGERAPVLTIPDSAVIDTGARTIVLVQRGEGRFEPREVKLGQRGDDYDEVLDGVREGEPVVVAANFLIDAESNLKAAIGGFDSRAAQGAAASAPVGSAAASAPAVAYQGIGSVDEIDAQAGTLTLAHEAIAALHWPAMTMDFTVANPSLLAGLKPGMRVNFEFVQREPGVWVITSVQRQSAKAPAAHAGH